MIVVSPEPVFGAFGATDSPQPSTLLYSVLGVAAVLGAGIFLLAPKKAYKRGRRRR